MVSPLDRCQAMAARRKLYDQGFHDSEIALSEGAKINTIIVWRRKAGLPVHRYNRMRALDDSRIYAARMLLYQMGWSDYQIAREQGVKRDCVHSWRRCRGLASNCKSGGQERQNRRPTIGQLLQRIRQAIGSALPRDVAEDAASDLLLALLDGTLSIERIEKDARRFGNKVLERFASKFGPRSIDEVIAGTEDLRLIDTLVDTSSQDWLEEMGATVAYA